MEQRLAAAAAEQSFGTGRVASLMAMAVVPGRASVPLGQRVAQGLRTICRRISYAGNRARLNHRRVRRIGQGKRKGSCAVFHCIVH